MPNPQLQQRKALSGDALIRTLRDRFDTLPDARVAPSISLTDALMSAFAVYALKMGWSRSIRAKSSGILVGLGR